MQAYTQHGQRVYTLYTVWHAERYGYRLDDRQSATERLCSTNPISNICWQCRPKYKHFMQRVIAKIAKLLIHAFYLLYTKELCEHDLKR